MVEQWNHNSLVMGSSPFFVSSSGYSAAGSVSVLGTEGPRFKSSYPEIIRKNDIIEKMAEWLKAVDCKSIGITYTGSNPVFFII